MSCIISVRDLNRTKLICRQKTTVIAVIYDMRISVKCKREEGKTGAQGLSSAGYNLVV